MPTNENDNIPAQEEQSRFEVLRNKYDTVDTEVTPSIETEKKSFFERAKEWVKNAFEKVTSAIKNIIPTPKEGGLLERLEVRALAGKDEYIKHYVSPDTPDEELVDDEKNRVSNLSNDEQGAPDIDPSNFSDDAATVTQNGNKVFFQEVSGIKPDTKLVSFVARTPEGTGQISTIGNGKTIDETTFKEVKENIQGIRDLAKVLKEREKYRTPLRGKEYNSKAHEGGTLKTEKLKIQGVAYKVTHSITKDGNHNISAFSPDRNVSFVITGAKSFKDAVSTLEGLVDSSEEVLKNHPLYKEEEIPDPEPEAEQPETEEPEAEEQEKSNDTPVDPSEDVVEDEPTDEPIESEDEPVTPPLDEFSDYQTQSTDEVDEPVDNEPVEEPETVSEPNNTKEDGVPVVSESKATSVFDEILDDEPDISEEPINEEPEIENPKDNVSFWDSVRDSGTCGENLKWTLYQNGLLEIEGEGDMYNYEDIGSDMSAQWCHPHDIEMITEVNIKEGVTSIGNYAFSGCVNIENVTIPDSVKFVGTYAFFDCDHLTDVTLPSETCVLQSGFDERCNINVVKQEQETTHAAPSVPLVATNKEIDASDLSKGDIISQNGHHYIVTSLNEKRHEMSFATIDYDTHNKKWSPHKGSTVQTVPFDRVPDFSLEKKGERTELQKGDTFRTYNGIDGEYTGKKVVTLSNGQKTPIIPELVVKVEKVIERGTEEKDKDKEKSSSEQGEQANDKGGFDFAADTAPAEQPDVDEIKVDDTQDQPNEDAPIEDQCI